MSGALRHARMAAAIATLALAGCTAVARVKNAADEPCGTSLHDAFQKILVEQEEKPEVAAKLADAGATTLATVDLGPRPFALSSPSGADYLFFFEVEGQGCVLRLYGKHKGFWSYTNNLTYIANEPLPGCGCEE